MPELPDVEEYRSRITPALNKEISDVTVTDKDFVGLTGRTMKRHFKGKKFSMTSRRGKHLFVHTNNHDVVVMHFGMTGEINLIPKEEDLPEYTKIAWTVEDAKILCYINKRKLGFIEIIQDVDKYTDDKELGKDALEFSSKEFIKSIRTKSSAIKSALTDQSLIAGIGNVYADEILFQCGIYPGRKVDDFTDDALADIFSKMRDVLMTAIKKHADVDKLPDSYLLPHREEGADCPSCKGKIKKTKLSGRSTYYCSSCQKK